MGWWYLSRGVWGITQKLLLSSLRLAVSHEILSDQEETAAWSHGGGALVAVTKDTSWAVAMVPITTQHALPVLALAETLV